MCMTFYKLLFIECVCVCTGQLEPVQQAKHSSSAVDVTACFSQVREFWKQMSWPDSAGAFIFVTRLTDVSATATATHTQTHTHPCTHKCMLSHTLHI